MSPKWIRFILDLVILACLFATPIMVALLLRRQKRSDGRAARAERMMQTYLDAIEKETRADGRD